MKPKSPVQKNNLVVFPYEYTHVYPYRYTWYICIAMMIYASLQEYLYPLIQRVSGAHFTFGDDIDCNTCPRPGVPRVESHLFTVGGFLGNSKGMAWKTESMQNMGV